MAKRKMVSCAACRLSRTKCSEDCVLAPYFPSDDPDKFAVVQRVFGTSHIIKLLQGVEAEQRAEAVNSMVHEAAARMKDPIHGLGSEVHELQEKIAHLKSQLAATEEELVNVRCKYDKLLYFLRTGSPHPHDAIYPTEGIMYEEVDPLLLWEPIRDA
ncbi:hypothetical protein SUGI_0307220 [Cryptomeria japonica]|uniref:LOB domain-containing protein 11-like n=1 Tax=Cryptomeria japonica TaxID=3369 RepID=UPI002408D46D|nr:LOB domain-containing protein 11-like [Cryptomeria japonica]GLJ17640.1 hypothetical protein SUGI_0307220 [Cryptomeria japonica]